MPRPYFVYILASDSRHLYVGVTGNIVRRVAQHRAAVNPDGYTAQHTTIHLVYCESTTDVLSAIIREKQIKGWTRKKNWNLWSRLIQIGTTMPRVGEFLSFGPFAVLRATGDLRFALLLLGKEVRVTREA
jgi:putative endonuclease